MFSVLCRAAWRAQEACDRWGRWAHLDGIVLMLAPWGHSLEPRLGLALVVLEVVFVLLLAWSEALAMPVLH